MRPYRIEPDALTPTPLDWRAVDAGGKWLVVTETPETVLTAWENWPANYDSEAFYHNFHRPNVAIAALIHTQSEADERIPELLKLRDLCGVIGLWVEPWERIDVSLYLKSHSFGIDANFASTEPVGWLITSGSERPVHPDWLRSLRDDAAAASVPYWHDAWGDFRQWDASIDAYKPGGMWLDESGKGFAKVNSYTAPGYTLMRRVGRENSGHLLDGVAWRQIPEGMR